MSVTEPMDRPFVWQVRVYWEDTDGGGVVYHARYLNYFERARTEWLRTQALNQSALAGEHDLVFAVRRMEIDFVLPARLDDELQVSAKPVTVGAARVGFEQEIHRVADGMLLASARVDVACLSASDFRAVRMPAWLRRKMTGED